jgi:hypothetical protein
MKGKEMSVSNVCIAKGNIVTHAVRNVVENISRHREGNRYALHETNTRSGPRRKRH